MKTQKGLTRIDVAVTLACIAFILAEASVLNADGRERSKRELCLANLRMLTAAWQAYADDNAGKVVNGAPTGTGDPCPGCPGGSEYMRKARAQPAGMDPDHANELPWIGPAYGAVNDCSKKCAIQTGALWKYTQNLDFYCCPDGRKDQLISYAVVDGVNGMTTARGPVKTVGVWKKNTNQILKPASRFVFIDEGYPSPDSYAVNYNIEYWFDQPPVRHEAGTCVSFADGHSAYHKWKAKETIIFGSKGLYNTKPTTCDGKNDLYWVQIGCWGQLGYTPSCPVNIE
jgi:hypothetical protein